MLCYKNTIKTCWMQQLFENKKHPCMLKHGRDGEMFGQLCLSVLLPHPQVQLFDLLEGQQPLLGQPIHVCPLFLALTTYVIAEPKMAMRTMVAMILISICKTSFDYFFLLLYSLAALALDRMPRNPIMTMMAITVTSPGTKPLPSLDSVIKVPI